jgi:CelD/BcsL family acetyltransferase involved in cellulose biosynthesis
MTATLELEPTPSAPAEEEWLRSRLFTTLGDFAELEPAWRLLGEQTGGPIEQFDWVITCAKSGPSDRRPQLLAAARGSRLVGLMPLELKRVKGVRRLVLLGVDELHEPMGLLAADLPALSQVAESLARQRRPVLLDHLVVDEPRLSTLRRELSEDGFVVVVRSQPGYPWIPLDAAWQEPEVHLNSGRRSDLRRARRKAEKLGDVVTEILSPQPAELDALLDEALEVEARSWKGRQGTALARDAARAAFYRRYAHAICRQGKLRMCFLRIAGQAVAMQIAVVQGGGFWLLKIGYDADFCACSPGVLLLRDSIAYATGEGLTSFEFLGQSEPWIAMWTDRERKCVSVRAYPYNLHGGAALAADVAVKTCEVAGEKTRQAGGWLRRKAKACVMPLLNRAARHYIAGDTLEDALRVKQRLAAQGLAATIGFWDDENVSGRAVADQYLAGLEAMGADGPESYLSIKLPALRMSADLLHEVAKRAVGHSDRNDCHSERSEQSPAAPQTCVAQTDNVGRRIHFDAMAPDSVDRTWQMIDELRAAVPGIEIGCTLPGRWSRSPQDARWASERGLFVRVVKGQWPDPEQPNRDPRAGYLEVIDQLAGRASRVAVATHDVRLAAEAIRRLKAAGTPCDQELLFGLPMRRSIRQARSLGIGVRVYVPYGAAYMPYALSQVRRQPRVLWWLARDAVLSWLKLG